MPTRSWWWLPHVNVVQNPTWGTCMFNASIAPRLIAVGEPHDQTSRVLVSEGGFSPPCDIVVIALRERAISSVAGRMHTPAGDRRKKKRSQPRLIPTRGATCACPQPQILSSAVETHYN